MNIEEIENFICESLKEVIDVPPDELARDTTFDALGLDSISRVGLVTQLGNAVGREIDPEMAYEHGSPHRLAVHVAALLGGESNS
ncbi:MAG: acyl carrier protein [Planctomycetia bacterium]|nr:acyl carrier protein [Planctomycetia bacterium]